MSEIEELELPILCNDTNFKNVFIYEEDIVVKMVSDIIGISHQILSNNVILVYNDQSIYTRIEKVKRCDFIIRILDDMIINLELNPESYSGMLGKGISYLSQLFDTSSNMYERSDKDLLIAQINFNCYKEELSKPLAKYVLSEVDINKLYERNIKFFDLNVGKCYEVYCDLDNKDRNLKYIKWGALIYCDNMEEIPDIVNGIMTEEERDVIISRIDELVDKI